MRESLLSFASSLYLIVSRTPRVTVLTLHRVGSASTIHPEHVAQCFRFLARNFRLVHPSELDSIDHKRVAVVTVDDGHADAYQSIFPIARMARVPISLCIPTDFFFRHRWLWFDRVTWAMRHALCRKIIQICGLELRTDDPRSFAELRQYLKRLPPPERDQAIDQLLGSMGLEPPSSPPEEYRAVTISELREMLATGLVEIIGHTVTHTIATVLSEGDLDAELRQAKDEWESFCGKPIPSFCYPNGESGDFDARTGMALQKAGYRYAFTSVEGTNRARTMNPFEINRVHIHPNRGTCAKLLSGLGDLQNSLGITRPAKPGETTPSRR